MLSKPPKPRGTHVLHAIELEYSYFPIKQLKYIEASEDIPLEERARDFTTMTPSALEQESLVNQILDEILALQAQIDRYKAVRVSSQRLNW